MIVLNYVLGALLGFLLVAANLKENMIEGSAQESQSPQAETMMNSR